MLTRRNHKNTSIFFLKVIIGVFSYFLRLIPNCIFKAKSERRKLFIGDQLEECKDYSGLFYVLPFQKGFLVNWDVEKQIWDYMFGKEVMKVTGWETYCSLTCTLLALCILKYTAIYLFIFIYLLQFQQEYISESEDEVEMPGKVYKRV